MGPPGTTARLYFAQHAAQIVLLHAASGKSGRGKLAEHTKKLVEGRLRQWRAWFPIGAEVDDQGRLVTRGRDGGTR